MSRILWNGLVHEANAVVRDLCCGVPIGNWIEKYKAVPGEPVTCLECLAAGPRPAIKSPKGMKVYQVDAAAGLPLAPRTTEYWLVTSDPDPKNNGVWIYDGAQWNRLE